MKSLYNAITALAVFGCVIVTTQDPSAQDADALGKQVSDNSLRIARLEHADGVKPGSVGYDGPSASDDSVARSMIVGSVDVEAPGSIDQGEVDDLHADIDSLQDAVDYHQDNAATIGGSVFYDQAYYSDGYYSRQHSNHDADIARHRAQHSQEEIARRYQAHLHAKKHKVEALEKAANEPHQIIHGHDGETLFTLRTKHTLARHLQDINIGDTVTWLGTRVAADETSETWEITSIRKIDR